MFFFKSKTVVHHRWHYGDCGWVNERVTVTVTSIWGRRKSLTERIQIYDVVAIVKLSDLSENIQTFL